MNAIINWVALNNTLLIRIGFSAVIILILVYAYRFFFVPEISVVETEQSRAAKSAAKAGSDLNIEELAELQLEVENLKSQLKQAVAEKAAASVSSVGSTEAMATPASAGLDMVAEQTKQLLEERTKSEKELSDKVKNLEARLSEYEIIAEDIAEISKLKQENESLKTKLAENEAAPVKARAADPAEVPRTETPPETFQEEVQIEEVMAVDEAVDPELEALENYAAEKKIESDASGSQVADAALNEEEPVAATTDQDEIMSQILLKSEVPVTTEEKNNLNDFEKFIATKKG
ncbi:MAG: hypothetical protein ACXWQQ_12700 [Pseudobdellovibrio sp.]